jgi:hypothetical protein
MEYLYCVNYTLRTVNVQFRFVKEVENPPFLPDLCLSTISTNTRRCTISGKDI